MSSFVNLNDFFLCGRREHFYDKKQLGSSQIGTPSLLDGSHMVGWIFGGPA